METALNEITLVLFTTLAPSGALAYGIMALPLIFQGGAERLDPAVRQRLDQMLCLPLFVAMVGLVASATHLGSPANALYVVTGFGRSPLSNEVVCGAVFLGAAGLFWLTSFSEGPVRLPLRRGVAAVISVLGLVFVGTISLAYSSEAIISWNTPFAPVSTWLNALSGGPLLAVLGMRLARFRTPSHRMGWACLGVAAAAFVCSVVLYGVWCSALPEFANAVASADELAPWFGIFVGVFAVMGAGALGLCWKSVIWDGAAPVWMPVVAAALMLCGIFLMRFQFYAIHLTAGLGV